MERSENAKVRHVVALSLAQSTSSRWRRKRSQSRNGKDGGKKKREEKRREETE